MRERETETETEREREREERGIRETKERCEKVRNTNVQRAP